MTAVTHRGEARCIYSSMGSRLLAETKEGMRRSACGCAVRSYLKVSNTCIRYTR